MTEKLAVYTSKFLALFALTYVSALSIFLWHQPEAPEELLQKK
ncbi:cyclic lactone autoinducer peptide [Chengkuizengella marina]|uniref:Cyclic lactone autoinducer peptide n=1 Tax=Chengkuizengella marina TaxID=2507566 RepID=A0A6N9Q0F1_9BACL|nr:cyclic lactone autoinducer peptide [Chengkuizengella marina]NBI28656.1 cyclic lactone autoinducer peptide [Chengkuizengella marina]